MIQARTYRNKSSTNKHISVHCVSRNHNHNPSSSIALILSLQSILVVVSLVVGGACSDLLFFFRRFFLAYFLFGHLVLYNSRRLREGTHCLIIRSLDKIGSFSVQAPFVPVTFYSRRMIKGVVEPQFLCLKSVPLRGYLGRRFFFLRSCALNG